MPDGPTDEVLLQQRRRFRDGLLISLTFATGIVDATSYLGLGQIFTANMTGNTVFFAIAVGEGNILTAARSVVALVGFAVGALVASRHLDRAKGPDPWPRVVTEALYAEIGIVAVFAIAWSWVGGRPGTTPSYLLIAVLSLGMGVQSAVGRRLAVPGVSTNVITMAMTGLMAELAAVGISGPNVRRWGAAILALGLGAALGTVLFVDARIYLAFSILALVTGVGLAATWHDRPTTASRG